MVSIFFIQMNQTEANESSGTDTGSFVLMYVSLGIAVIAIAYLVRLCYSRCSKIRRQSYGLDIEGRDLIHNTQAHQILEEEL